MHRLIRLGADLEARDPEGRTALIRSTWGGRLESVRILLRAGADIDAKALDGWSACHYASLTGNLPLLKLLLQQGADVNTQANSGCTPLLEAAAAEHPACALALIEAGAQVQVARHGGVTALHEAACAGHVDLVQVLLQQGAVPDARNGGETPAYFCNRWWSTRRSIYASISAARKQAILAVLETACAAVAVWRTRRLPIMFQARHAKGYDITAGSEEPPTPAEDSLRELMLWVSKRPACTFRHIVAFL
ncbi:unnamed protein product [Chrysoparadoxa australica]